MTVGGRSVDLVKLYFIVKKKGGYKGVTENGLWESVAKECGFSDASDGLALKLVYAENLERFLELLTKVSEDENLKSVLKVENSISDNCGGDFSSKLEMVLSGVCEIKMKKNGSSVELDRDNDDSDLESLKRVSEEENLKSSVKVEENNILDYCSRDFSSKLELVLSGVCDIKMKKGATPVKVDQDNCDSDDVCVRKLPEMVYCHDAVKLNGDIENYHTKRVPKYVKEECPISLDFKPIKTAAFKKGCVSVIDKRSDSSVVKEDVCCLKRKRDSAIGILDWIHRVSCDPCDPAIGALPESSKWKDHASDITWKQVLLIRDAMLSKRNGYSNDQHFNMQVQKRQRMHPVMYNEPEKFRHSPRILSSRSPLKKLISQTLSKSSNQKRDDNGNPRATVEFPDYLSNKHHETRVLVGRKYQADLDEWTEKKSPYEVDSKWSGTRVWPPSEKSNPHNKNLTKHEPLIGKGRSESCGCQFPGCTECVQFHVSEKGKRLKSELGSVFYIWRFNQMGEATSFTWTKEEENKFLDTWKLNPVLSIGGFLDQTHKVLPHKSRASLANYYFNVVLLRRRGEQNRTTPNDITSDDDIDDDDDNEEDDEENTIEGKARIK